MIEASFGRAGRGATVHGAYQYDTGQRLRLYGLPSPIELAEMDDFLDGDIVSVQAQYAHVGDSQTEARIAVWDEEACVWTAAVPDAYMLEHEDVHVYVYVGYGQTEDSMRTKTMYEAVFRPIARPAPSDSVTPDQKNEWDALVQEINLALTNVETASSNANAAATQARETSEKFDAMQVAATTLPEGSDALAEIEDKGSYKKITFGIPVGATGPQGVPGVFSINGKEVTNNTELVLTAGDVGARPEGGELTEEYTAVVDWTAFTAGSNGWYTQEIAVEGIRASDDPFADAVMDTALTAEAAQYIENDWSLISRIETADGKITVYCSVNPAAHAATPSLTIRLLAFR